MTNPGIGCTFSARFFGRHNFGRIAHPRNRRSMVQNPAAAIFEAISTGRQPSKDPYMQVGPIIGLAHVQQGQTATQF
jgi:hypothetical protein